MAADQLAFFHIGAQKRREERSRRDVSLGRRFRGESQHKVDTKGRVSIPASFRRVLESGDTNWQSGNNPELVIVYGDDDRKFLECYTIEAIDEVDAKIDALPRGSMPRKALQKLFHGHSFPTTVDETGRLVLPAKLRNKIGLKGEEEAAAAEKAKAEEAAAAAQATAEEGAAAAHAKAEEEAAAAEKARAEEEVVAAQQAKVEKEAVVAQAQLEKEAAAQKAKAEEQTKAEEERIGVENVEKERTAAEERTQAAHDAAAAPDEADAEAAAAAVSEPPSSSMADPVPNRLQMDPATSQPTDPPLDESGNLRVRRLGEQGPLHVREYLRMCTPARVRDHTNFAPIRSLAG